MAAVYQLLRQIQEGNHDLENEYTRAVAPQGNPMARQIMAETFTWQDDVWRGLGTIPNSGYALRPEFSAFDAARKFDFQPEDKEEMTGCKCGEIIRGRREPMQCPLFGKACLPENPVSAFSTIRAIFAEGPNLFLRPRRRSDRPASFPIPS